MQSDLTEAIGPPHSSDSIYISEWTESGLSITWASGSVLGRASRSTLGCGNASVSGGYCASFAVNQLRIPPISGTRLEISARAEAAPNFRIATCQHFHASASTKYHFYIDRKPAKTKFAAHLTLSSSRWPGPLRPRLPPPSCFPASLTSWQRRSTSDVLRTAGSILGPNSEK